VHPPTLVAVSWPLRAPTSHISMRWVMALLDARGWVTVPLPLLDDVNR
jgi:hypothetical protein